jgi:hypothetical protein
MRLSAAAVVVFLLVGAGYADSLVVQGQDAAGIYDNKLYENYDCINFGASQTLAVLQGTGGGRRRLLFKFTKVDTVGTNKIVDSMKIELYCLTANGATVAMHELLKPWYEGSSDNAVEAGASDDNHWYHSDSSWGKELADSADDSGSQNRFSGTGPDRKAMAMDSETISTGSTWYVFWVDVDLARDWYDGTKEAFGVIFRESSNVAITTFASSENSTTANRPRVTIYYHDAATGEASRRRSALVLNSM